MKTMIDPGRVEIKLGNYGVAPATALADHNLLPAVQDYRRAAGSRMYPLDRDDITKKIPTADYHVSRKVDGEFTVLIYRDGHAFTLNPGGTVRVGLPWLAEAERALADANVTEAMIAGELYVQMEDRRPRVHDVTTVARQPQSEDDLARLRFAVFDIIALDTAEYAVFAETWNDIQRIFGQGDRVHPVEAKACGSSEEVQTLFDKWVIDEGAEGLVVRSDTVGTFKIKPRHTLDAVVIGFTESSDDRQGMLHDLLLAVMRPDNTLHVLSRVGGGFSDEQRREMLSDLKDMVVESEYAEVNSDHVAYQMVQPNWVVEISCLDLISQTTRGGPVNRMVLDYRDNGRQQYDVVRRLPLAAVISPQFVRRREDKTAHAEDIRIAQVSERVEVPLADRDARQLTLPTSELIKREVYTKVVKEQTMVRKFLMWKTNKEADNDEYPAYVVHYTDFSPNRKAPLAREVRVSASREQIEELWETLKEQNIKKGWEIRASSGSDAQPVAQPAADAEPAAAPAKKVAAKKKAAKKTPAKKAAAKKAPAKKPAAKKAPAKKTAKKKMAASARPTKKKAAKKKSG